MRNFIIAAIAAVSAAGCAAPATVPVETPRMEAQYAQRGDLPVSHVREARWWDMLEDVRLGDLIDRALEANHDVRVAVERLSQSRALIDGTRAEYLPAGGLGAGVERGRRDGGIGKRYDAAFDASWEIDVFGRVRDRVDAASALHDAYGARLEDVRLSVAAEVARAYFQLAGARDRERLALDALERQRSIMRVVAARVREGFADPVDERRTRAELHAAEAALPLVRMEATAAMARIAVLLGQNPSAFKWEGPQPQQWRVLRFAVGSPVALLDTRPDLREAEARIRSLRLSTESIRKEFFPRFVVSGLLGFVSGHAAALGTALSETWSLGASAGVAIFDVPRIQARLESSRSEERQALLHYQQRILLAVEDIETSLNRYHSGAGRLEALRSRLQEATAAARLAKIRYDAGRSDFLELLEAERSSTAAEVELSLAVAAQRTAVVSVIKAFGTGWKPEAQ